MTAHIHTKNAGTATSATIPARPLRNGFHLLN